MQDGHCSFGERCTYAHGEDDLRPSYVPANSAEQQMSSNYDQNNMNMGQDNGNDYQINNVIPESRNEIKAEVIMSLLDDSHETKVAIHEIVRCLKAQNYEDAKKLVTVLHGKFNIHQF